MSEVTLESQLFDIIKDEEMPENIKLAKIDMLIKLGVDVNAMYGAKSTLKLANEVNNQKIIEFLEENGAKEFFDEEIANKLSQKLVKACGWMDKNIKEIKELVDMGADVNIKEWRGITPLMLASDQNCKETVKLLLQKGGNINEQNNDGKTALMYASIDGNDDVVEILIKNGADVNLKRVDGKSAIELALNEKTRKVIFNAIKERKVKAFLGKIKRGFGIGE